MTVIEHAAYALLWMSFGALHSILADQRVKQSFQDWVGSRYRLAYNVVATLHFALIFLLGRLWLAPNAVEFELPNYLEVAFIGIQILGLGIIIVALSHYDLGRFSGMTQIRGGEPRPDGVVTKEPLHTGGLHRWVRHPLYLGLFLVLWARSTDEFALATAIWASVYLIVGTRLEEQRLIEAYGDDYKAYRSEVPMYVPWQLFKP